MNKINPIKTAADNKARQINQRAHEIRYGDGCSAEDAIRRATEELEQWDRAQPISAPSLTSAHRNVSE